MAEAMPALVVTSMACQSQVADCHRDFEIAKVFQLLGVRDELGGNAYPALPLASNDDLICRSLSAAMSVKTTPTASCDELKSQILAQQSNACLVNGKRVLSFGQISDHARRQGQPIRFDQAWGAPRHIWFHLSERLQCALSDLLNNEGDSASQGIGFRSKLSQQAKWLLDAIRSGTVDRPTVHIGKLLKFLQKFVTDVTEIKLLKYIDQMIKVGLPIRRSHSSSGEVYVWFHFDESTLALIEKLQQQKGLERQTCPSKKVFVDRYKELKEGTTKCVSDKLHQAEHSRSSTYVPMQSNGVSQSKAATVSLPLTYYSAEVLQRADRLAHFWMRLHPGRYHDNVSCVKLIIILIRTVAVRQSWYRDQKRLYMELIIKRIKMWAPELIQNDLTVALQTAQKLGTTINWSPSSKRINVARLLAPIICELRPRGE